MLNSTERSQKRRERMKADQKQVIGLLLELVEIGERTDNPEVTLKATLALAVIAPERLRT